MIAAVTMVRNEQDIIGYTLRHLLEQNVDHIWVADNLSCDRTSEILHGFPRSSVTIVDDPDPAFDQSAKMTRLCALDAEWVLPFDADEWWYATDSTIGEALRDCPADVVLANGWDHIPTIQDAAVPSPFEAIPNRRRRCQKLPKCAFRPSPGAVVHHGNHDVTRNGQRIQNTLMFRHFQYRSLDQLIRKVRQGKKGMDDAQLHPMYGTHWRTLGSLTDEDLGAYWENLLTETDLIFDPAP